MTKRNFLIGKGERLVEDVVGIRGGGLKEHPYTFSEAKARLAPMLGRVVQGIDQLPDAACPDDRAVATVILNPEYIAKSYSPEGLLQRVGLESVGSRPSRIVPEKRSKNRPPEESVSTELFVMGPRSAFRSWHLSLPDWREGTLGASELSRIERVSTPTAQDKIKGEIPNSGDTVFEVVLHCHAALGENTIIPDFYGYLEHLGIRQTDTRRFYVSGLCFLELGAPAELVEEIVKFTSLRALRPMPRLRGMRPTLRAAKSPSSVPELPRGEPIDPNTRVAIFDGGVPAGHPVGAWTRSLDGFGVGGARDDFQEHGVAVTSAFLFGHIDQTNPLNLPYASVDHYRVLDTSTGRNERELFDVLERVERVLVEQPYEFINLSIGPELPIEDDEVHVWTAVLDDRLSDATTFASIAVGNGGDRDAAAGLNRIQVPADCVNGLSVGACDSPETPWQRCSYSSVGPGRSPGLVKPDLVEFGGCEQHPFVVLSGDRSPRLKSDQGTSLAAPAILRLAAGIRAHFGSSLGTLAIRALLIHTAERCGHEFVDVGRGRAARSVEDVVTCDDDTIRVVYQGKVSPARYIRAPIPVPSETMPGKVFITATLCFTTEVDAHHPGNYTRAGLEATFRPHDRKRKSEKQTHPNSRSFFGDARRGMTEADLRRDAWKWENVLHGSQSLLGRSLSNPVFDIHYNSRLEGRNFAPDKELAYVLIVSVHANELSDFYNTIVRRYATVIEPLRPAIEIPVSV